MVGARRPAAFYFDNHPLCTRLNGEFRRVVITERYAPITRAANILFRHPAAISLQMGTPNPPGPLTGFIADNKLVTPAHNERVGSGGLIRLFDSDDLRHADYSSA